ncbi:hypothetical protein Leryth_023868 [Lithospermum erythrorhizon]|nr:hypothetical protein Leryth_023868 [Lithospermum erythrorhizon]
MFKWTLDFCPNKESLLSPVWIHLQGLPLYLFDDEPLLLITNSIGNPLHIDQNNVNRVTLGQASVCGFGCFEVGCCHLGHTVDECKRKDGMGKTLGPSLHGKEKETHAKLEKKMTSKPPFRRVPISKQKNHADKP